MYTYAARDPETVRRRVRRFALFLVAAPFFIAAFVFGFGFAVKALWNWLMPLLFHLPSITFGQAWGLLALSWILLGGFRGVGGYARPSRRQRRERWERWQRMTPEQRAAVREAFGSRWACPPSEPTAPDAASQE
jgi:hypothetical protein